LALRTWHRLFRSNEMAEESRKSKWVRLPLAKYAARTIGGVLPGFLSKRLASSGPRRVLPRLRTVGRACSVQGFGTGAGPGRGSSEAEHQVFNLGVTGSTPVHRTRSRLKTDCSGTLKTSRPLGPRGTGGRVGRPSSGLKRPSWRDGRTGATRTGALKHADAALRRWQGDADGTHVVGFRPHGRASRSGPDLSAGSAQAGLRAPKRDRRTIRSPTAFYIKKLFFMTFAMHIHDP
jgi:hypothetical protein